MFSTESMDGRVIFHVDFDYFYAQCEEMRNPTLKGKPVIVCVYSDRGQDSGAVATANYVARKYGVRSGIPIQFAKKRLESITDAAFLPVDFDYYLEITENAMGIIQQNADVFEYVGRDEAYLDVTKKTNGDFTKAAHLAQQIKNQIYKKIKMTCSIGVSPNKLLSKIASDFKKPDGLTIVEPEKISVFLEPLKINDIPGIGKKTGEIFAEMSLKTIGDLKKLDVFTLNRHFGRRSGTYIYNAARGIDTEAVKEKEPNIQFSKIVTLKQNSKEYEFLRQYLEEICGQLNQIILQNNKMFKSVGIQFFQSDLSSKTKSKMLRNPTNSLDELKKAADALLVDALRDQRLLIRRLGVKVSELTETKGQNSITNYF